MKITKLKFDKLLQPVRVHGDFWCLGFRIADEQFFTSAKYLSESEAVGAIDRTNRKLNELIKLIGS